MMNKLAKIAKIVVNLREKYDLSKEDPPASLRGILVSLPRFVSLITTRSLTLSI